MSHFDFMMTYVLFGHLIILIRPSLDQSAITFHAFMSYNCNELFFNSQFLCDKTDILFYFIYELTFCNVEKERQKDERQKIICKT